MRKLRALQTDELVWVKMHPRFSLTLQREGKGSAWVTSNKPVRSRDDTLGAFYGIITLNDTVAQIITVRPTKSAGRSVNGSPARIPYNYLYRILVFSGQTNEETVKNHRYLVGGSAVSNRNRQAWDNRKRTLLPLEQPHTQPASDLYTEVLIG
jgi:hypothetical protein